MTPREEHFSISPQNFCGFHHKPALLTSPPSGYVRTRRVAEVVSVDAATATAFSEVDTVVTFAVCAADVAALVP